MNNRVPSTVVVRQIDFSAFMEYALPELQPSNEGLIAIRHKGEIGIVIDGEKVWILNNEGCDSDPFFHDDEKIKVPFYGEYRADEQGKAKLGMIPVHEQSFTIAQLKKHPYKEVPLHKFIRVFGGRLESNYMLWREVLEGTVVSG